MELQWPLILFTTLLAASAGLFAAQGAYALAGKGGKAQLPALATSAVLLVAAGVAVFFHLEHWERIFNGFGHLTSGITQELIAVVATAAVMVAYFVMLRRGGGVPKWCAVLAIVASAALVLVAGLSYLMAARPAWNSALQALSLFGAALAVGAGLFAFLDRSAEEDFGFHGLFALVGTVANAVLSAAFVFAMSSARFADVGHYFDPNHPTAAMASAAAFSPFAGGTLPLTVLALVLALAAVAFALVGKKSGKWAVAGVGIALCALVGAALLRAVFFASGGSVFMFY